MPLNKREKQILKWVKDNRPDLNEGHILPAFENQGLHCLMSIAFEAGRQFQKDNPKASFDPGQAYL